MYLFATPLQEGIILKRNSQFTMEVLLNNKIVKYTVEAISCDEYTIEEKNWIGINQILSNKLVEYFLTTHQLKNMIGEYESVKREVPLGISKLDFLVDNTYIEVKTPLTTIHVEYGANIKRKPITPFSSTERFTKHINELANSLNKHERAILLTVYQYQITCQKSHQKSTHYLEVHNAMDNA